MHFNKKHKTSRCPIKGILALHRSVSSCITGKPARSQYLCVIRMNRYEFMQKINKKAAAQEHNVDKRHLLGY